MSQPKDNKDLSQRVVDLIMLAMHDDDAGLSSFQLSFHIADGCAMDSLDSMTLDSLIMSRDSHSRDASLETESTSCTPYGEV